MTISAYKSPLGISATTPAVSTRKPRRSTWDELAARLRDNVLQRGRFFYSTARRAMGIAPPRRFSQEYLAQGLTIVLPGIEAESIYTYGICDGLAAGGLAGAFRVFNWGLPFPGGYLGNLVRHDRNRRRAAEVARMIMSYQDEFPGRPVRLAAHSGGAGVAVFALENLPAERAIDGAVLLHGALSPTYDLSGALARTRRGILSTASNKDFLVLNLGTRIFGTTDRRFTPACGHVGFTAPSGADSEQYAKLRQLHWDPAIGRVCGHSGGHMTSAAEDFLTQFVAPWLLADV